MNEKLEQLRTELANIPFESGKQFIIVELLLGTNKEKDMFSSGKISFGFNYKSQMGEIEFRNLDEAISIIAELRKENGV